MVVFPEPEGAEKMMALPVKGAGELIGIKLSGPNMSR
jgi:hypothetical protein